MTLICHQHHLTKNHKNGQLGLGLHIVQQLLQKQGGEVTAHIHDDIFVLTLLFYKKNKI